MTDLRKAAEMALEALEDIFGKEKKDVGAINALRQALDYPTPEQIALAQQIRPKGKSKIEQALAQPCLNYSDKLTCGNNYCKNFEKREWVGLTDEEVKDTWEQACHHRFYAIETFELFAHNIEAKLKEKNT